MTVLLPAYLQGATYGALEDRQVLSAMVVPDTYVSGNTTVRSGVLPGHISLPRNSQVVSPPELRVEQLDPASMSLQVNAGHAVIQGTSSTTQGVYFIKNDSVLPVNVQVADNTNPRIDLVVLEVLDQAFAGSTSTGRLRVVQGQPSLNPVAPAVSGNYLTLASVRVAAGATSINASAITDTRQFTAMRGEPILCTSQTRPVPFHKARITELDTGRERTWIGDRWVINTNLELQGSQSYNFQLVNPAVYFQATDPIYRFTSNMFAPLQDVSMTTTYWMVFRGPQEQNFWPRIVLSYNIPVNQFVIDHRQMIGTNGYTAISVTQQSYFTVPVDRAVVPIEVFIGVQVGSGPAPLALGNAYFTARPVHR